jgi:hypothetical protein
MILKSTIYKLCIHRSAELFLLLPHLLGAKDIYIYIYICTNGTQNVPSPWLPLSNMSCK